MIINWVSPLPPARTDIANYTMRVLPALQKFAAIRLWTDQRVWDDSIEALAPVYSFAKDRFDEEIFSQADASFYHIGNNRLFHGGIWALAERAPGIIVLHDTLLLQFVAGVLLDQRHDRAAFDRLLIRHYGEEGRAAARALASGEKRIDDMVKSLPLARAVAENALAVIRHAPPPGDELGDLPGIELPLPFDVARAPPERTCAGDTLRLVQFGFIGSNRRLAQILEAIAGLEARETIRFDIYGPIDDEAALKSKIDSLGLSAQVRLHGFVPEEELASALDRANFVFNLRYPSMGEASASQLRIWAHARPAFVSDVAWYAAQPEATLVKVKPGEEITRIQEVLRAYRENPAPFEALGRAGFEHLKTNHSAAIYAERLLQCLEQLPDWRRHHTVRRVAAVAGHEMRTWLKQPPQTLLTAPVVARLHDLWGDGAASVAQPPPPARFNHPAFTPAKKLARRILGAFR